MTNARTHTTFQYFSFKLPIVIRAYSEKKIQSGTLFSNLLFFLLKIFCRKKHDVATRGALDSPAQNSLNQKCFFISFLSFIYVLSYVSPFLFSVRVFLSIFPFSTNYLFYISLFSLYLSVHV